MTRAEKQLEPSPSFDNLSFEQLAWAALFFHKMEGNTYDNPYQRLLQDNIVSNLRTNPGQLTTQEVKEKVITGFLLKWGCRPLQATDKLAKPIIKATKSIQPQLRVLDDKKLINLDIEANAKAIKACYDTVVNICYNGFSHTAASKLLHILNPEVFVIWDVSMRKHYKKHYDIGESGDGYCKYMKKMKEATGKIKISKALNKEGLCPAVFLSKKMGIEPSKTLVKFLDEYNWITITKKVELPPTWHP